MNTATFNHKKIVSTLLFSILVGVILYSLSLWSVLLIVSGVLLFLALRRISFHLWVPAFSGVLSLLLFGYVDQTLEIYRLLIEEGFKSTGQMFWGTFNVLWLSIFVWESCYLLSEKYSKNKINKLKEHWGDDDHSLLKKLGNNTEYLALTYLPRFIGVLPLGGLVIGVYKVIYKNSKSEALNIAGSTSYGLYWLISLLAVFVFLNILFFYRDSLRKLFCLQKNGRESKDSSYLNRNIGLYGNLTENIVTGLALLWFSALATPIVSKVSGKASIGVFAIFATFIIFDSLLFYFHCLENKGDKKKFKEICRNFLFMLLAHLILSVLFLVFCPPLFWSYFWGAISIAALCLSSFTVIFSTIYYWGYSTEKNKVFLLKYLPGKKIPAISLILLVALTSSQQNLNDNHRIRRLSSDSQVSRVDGHQIEADFSKWFTSRSDLNNFTDTGEYPVYIVSAQGGGIYAAYHAASTLAKLHDETDGNFSNHTFAVSGVSGGSIGSAFYSSLVKKTTEEDSKISTDPSSKLSCKTLSPCVQEVLGRDFLSPLLSLALFPDLLQRFIPLPINDWDRARGLELAIEDSWDKMSAAHNPSDTIDNPLSQQYDSFWNSQGKAPALVLNTTVAETGNRLVFSPFTISPTGPDSILDFEVEQSTFPLSTAAVLSARFPIVTPAGWFEYRHPINDSEEKEIYQSRLVDGGYFDNSGVATARDIINALETSSIDEELQAETGLKPRFINLAIVDKPQVDEMKDASEQGLNEILSPVRAALGVRSARASSIVDQAEYELNASAKMNADTRFRAVYLDKRIQDGVSLPLGWLLSETSRTAIEGQLPSEDPSPNQDCSLLSKDNMPIDAKHHNYCVSQVIFTELKS